jgi:apolipoprotein N-acyltransferase
MVSLLTRPRSFWIRALACIVGGCCLFLACPDFDLWPLAWVGAAPILWAAFHPDTKRPFWWGFLGGFVGNAGGFYWIVTFLMRFGHLPLAAALPIDALLVTYQALTFAFWAWATRRLHDHLGGGRLGITWLSAIVYVAFEMAIPYVFPFYLAITQGWVRPVIQIADVTGPLGVSFLLLLVNGAIVDVAVHRRAALRRAGAALALLAATLVYGQIRIHQVAAARAAAPKLKVGVVQANIGIHEKWRPHLAAQQLFVHQSLSQELEKRGADLIVWPESSYPYAFGRDQHADHPPGDQRRAKVGFKTPLLFGALTHGGGAPYPYNSAMLLDENDQVRGLFDKNLLVVFGEYIPYYEQMKWIKRVIPETSNWARGTEVEVFPLDVKAGALKAQVAPMICYEDIFPSFGRRLAAKRPNLLVNLTNDAWFGKTSEPWEHMSLAVYRAVELRLDLVRAVNTGVSSVIDSTGRVIAKTKVVDPDVPPKPRPETLLEEVAVQEPSTIYARLGEWVGALCLLLVALLAWRARTKAGLPVRWMLVAQGAGALLVVVLLGVLVTSGPGDVGFALELLALRQQPLGIEDRIFSVGVRLIGVVALGAVVAGITVARAAARGTRPKATLETAIAVLAIVVAPALVFGRLEGTQAGLVLSALASVGLATWAGRITRRRLAPAEPSPSSSPQPPSPTATRKKKRRTS